MLAVALSVCIGVFGCSCPNSLSILRVGTACFALMKSALSLAMAADDMSALIICTMLRMAPSFSGIGALFDRKKCPPALLHALGSLR